MDVVELIQKGKIRRYLCSRGKLSYPGAISHITQRAPGREKLFVEGSDYVFMLHLLKRSALEFKLKFFSFALMSNHVHLLFQLLEDNLSRAMQHLFHTYACYFNSKYERKGHTVCGRYRQALCFDETYLLASSVYIHINPVVAGIVKTSADYRWSSIVPFVTPFAEKTFVDYKFVLNLLDRNIESARLSYRELMNRSIAIKMKNCRDNKGAIEEFRGKFLKPLKDVAYFDNMHQKSITMELATHDFTQYKRKRHPKTIAAKAYVIQQLRAKGYTIAQIAERLGICRQTVYRISQKHLP